MRAPDHKQDFYRRFYRGEFGNATFTRSATDIADFANRRGLAAIRSKIPGHLCIYDIPVAQLPEMLQFYLAQGYTVEELNVSEMAPTLRLRLQGEVARTPRGLELLYSTEPLPMRPALEKAPQRLRGLQAKLILQSAMDADSWDWLNHLLDYDGDTEYSAIVEFSVYRCLAGELAGRNSVFWEVRNY